MDNFESFELPNFLRDSLKNMGISIPTPIQVASIPIALEGRDILASAETGSGKTIAYLLPIITNLASNSKSTALILAPTRELAIQVKNNLKQLLGSSGKLNIGVLIGGEEMRKQFDQLKRSPQIIVGTPGRICDHLNRGSLKLNNVNCLVLDETDRMLDMGFSEQLEYILQYVPSEKQTFMFSATLPVNIVKLSEKYLKNPERVQIGEINRPAAKIKQQTIQTRSSEKFTMLMKELEKRNKGSSVIIFVKTKRNAQEISDQLCEYKFNSEAMHGDLSQRKREKVIKDFRNQKTEIIVATDIAARGLDVPHIEYVFNYHLPECPEDYIHRIGRTGRAGAEGYAISLVAPEDNKKWQAIDRLIQGKSSSIVSREGRRPIFKEGNFNSRERRSAPGKRFSFSTGNVDLKLKRRTFKEKQFNTEGQGFSGSRSAFSDNNPKSQGFSGSRSAFSDNNPKKFEGKRLGLSQNKGKPSFRSAELSFAKRGPRDSTSKKSLGENRKRNFFH